MLEHVPAWLGRMLGGVRAGADKLAIVQVRLGGEVAALGLSSPAFADGAALPVRFTADGEGVSPPLLWDTVPDGTAALALLVEDADAPTPQPLVHAVVWGLDPGSPRLAEGALGGEREGLAAGCVIGRNSLGREGWLPPDPPTGHGPHRYCFQLFALDAGVVAPEGSPGRSALVAAMAGHVLAAGLTIGTYERSAPAAAALGQPATA